ncbi:hypothetical protein L873DRAFT_1821342, partial [Choiromyces venosus 120613-1]
MPDPNPHSSPHRHPHHRLSPSPTPKPPVNPPQTITATTPTQGITLRAITKTQNFYRRIYEVFKVDDTFVGTEQEKG